MRGAEDSDTLYQHGPDEDLDQAMKQALREMIAFICSRSNLVRAKQAIRSARWRWISM